MKPPIQLSDLKNSACAHLNQHLFEVEKKVKRTCKYKAWIEHRLNDFASENGLEVRKEYQFAKPRKFRFDWCFLDEGVKVAFEYEGIMSKVSRHTNKMGYSKDAEKYNLAQSLGWKVYRYTAINHLDLRVDLLNLKI